MSSRNHTDNRVLGVDWERFSATAWRRILRAYESRIPARRVYAAAFAVLSRTVKWDGSKTSTRLSSSE